MLPSNKYYDTSKLINIYQDTKTIYSSISIIYILQMIAFFQKVLF